MGLGIWQGSEADVMTLKSPKSGTRGKRRRTPKLKDKDLLEMYREMVLSRTLDERIWMLNRQGKAAIVASSQGHEAGQIGSVWALEKGKDLFYIYYRDLAAQTYQGRQYPSSQIVHYKSPLTPPKPASYNGTWNMVGK